LNEILGKHGDAVREHAWSLVDAIGAYADLLSVHRSYFNDEVGSMVGRVVDLLNELDKLSPSLGVIAWAYALAPALMYGYVRGFMEGILDINVVDMASEVLEELGKMRDEVQELMSDEEFMGYVESRFIKADEEAVKKVILDATSHLKHALAQYRFDNDELDKAEELFNEAAEEDREIGDYENYLVDRGWVLRVKAIKGPLDGNESTKLRNEFQQLYEETFNKKHFRFTAQYLGITSDTFGNYLMSLALTGDDKKISKLLEEHWWVLNADKQVSALTRLMLNALLGLRVELSSELKDKLSANPGELIDAFGSDMYSEFLPALRVALGIVKPEDGLEECDSIEDPTKRRDCGDAVSAVMNDSDAVRRLREKSINDFHEKISGNEKSGWLREFGFDVNALINEFEKLVGGLDSKSLVQLIAPAFSTARLALMLHALINGDEKLAKAHALMGATYYGKLLTRLFLEAYEACCDLNSKSSFRRAVAKLFFLEV